MKLDRTHAFILSSLAAFTLISVVPGCSSAPEVKTQAYAKLKNNKTFENDFTTVWKALEASLRNFRVIRRDPDDVDPSELKKLTHRTLQTDWTYSQSRDKYQEYKVNGSPRKIYLQTRYRYLVDIKTVMGGATVTVKTDEEIERLNDDGTPDGYSSVKETDPSRPSELLDKIQQSILSAPVI